MGAEKSLGASSGLEEQAVRVDMVCPIWGADFHAYAQGSLTGPEGQAGRHPCSVQRAEHEGPVSVPYGLEEAPLGRPEGLQKAQGLVCLDMI